MTTKEWLAQRYGGFLGSSQEAESPERYRIIKRNMAILMILITMVPLFIMAYINFHEYQRVLRQEILAPVRVLVNKGKHSIELFLAERLSLVSFIASDYSFEELANERRLNRLFRVMQQEFGGFVDLGLIDGKGVQVSYSGPYSLKGKDYSEQSWFQQVRVQGKYVSDVFMGYRKFPHVVIAVQRVTDAGETWIVRATIDTSRFDQSIALMGLDPESDAFLINREGVLQSSSKYYGKVLEKCPLEVPPLSTEPNVMERVDPSGREIVMVYSYFLRPDFILMVVKPKTAVLKAWSTLRSDLLVVFVISVAVILIAVFKITGFLVNRLKESDEKREAAYRQMEHSQKLSSIGRLAAGVAHEINNPLAIISEKAGLINDLIELKPGFPDKERFTAVVGAILKSVERCRTITHRLLGFARRMEVQIEFLDLNDIVSEVMGFLEKEALYRNVQLTTQLAADLPRIASDRGQLQQVFLNLINNALAAVEDGGKVAVTTFERDVETIGVSVQDNGTGMSKETMRHIFEPFFTTKKGSGTGLGLSITYGIVKKLGGDIDVHSTEGAGSTFTVFLPKKARGEEGT
jgi:two-component system, NtrC family, sensor kinase